MLDFINVLMMIEEDVENDDDDDDDDDDTNDGNDNNYDVPVLIALIYVTIH